jgi:hypothetical protein
VKPPTATPTPPEQPQVETKASVFRGYLKALDGVGLLHQVRGLVSAETAAMIDDPPLITAWLPSQPTDEILLAVERLRGLTAVRHLAREATLVGLAPVVRTLLEGTLRLFEVSPATLLSRLPQLTASTARGVRWQWEPESRSAGRLVVRYPARRNIPACVYHAIAGSLETVFVLSGTEEGTVAEPEELNGSERNAAGFRIRW